MGGAERNARKRRQEQLMTAQAARQRSGTQVVDPDRTKKLVLTVVGVVVLIAVVVGGLLWMNAGKNATEGQAIPPQTAHAGIPSTREGVAVVAGSPQAQVTLDVYADFLCPACRQFEEVYGDRIAKRMEAGEVRVRYHMVPMLTNRSDPPGYSLDAANASLCAADEGQFVPFHDSLFAAQPDEGARGYDNAQLVALGRALGITGGGFAACVGNGTYNDELTAAFERIKDDPRLQQDFGNGPGFGTPTIVHDGKIVDVSDDAWLSELVKAAG